MVKKRIWGFAVAIALIWSCNFVEEIHFEEDRSGRIDIHFDGNELMAMVGAMDSTNQEKAIDSTLVFRDLFKEKKDSIAKLSQEEQEKLKKLEPFSMRMVVDPEQQIMKFNFFSEFKSVSEVNDAFNAFQDASAFDPIGGTGAANSPNGMPVSQQATKVTYSFSGDTFTRTIAIVDPDLFKKSLDSLQSTEMFLAGSTYTFKYHFPKKIKATNVDEATFSLDGKTMTYEVDFLEMMKDPESIVLEVELEE